MIGGKRVDDQTRHNFVGEIRICSVKIRINPYHSYICINVSRKRSRDSYHDAVFAKKIATLCNTNRHPAAKKTKSELYFTGRDRRIRPTPLID